jgi:hypothetical protein
MSPKDTEKRKAYQKEYQKKYQTPYKRLYRDFKRKRDKELREILTTPHPNPAEQLNLARTLLSGLEKPNIHPFGEDRRQRKRK